MISVNDKLNIGLGDSLTLISSILFAAYIIIAAYYVKKDDAAVIATVQFGVIGFLALIVVLVVDPIPSNLGFSRELISLIYLGFIGSAVAYYMQIVCQKYTSPTATSIILSTETIFGSFLAVLFLGDVFTLKMVIGSIIILLAILISEI